MTKSATDYYKQRFITCIFNQNCNNNSFSLKISKTQQEY